MKQSVERRRVFRVRLAELELTASEAAQRAGISSGVLSRIINGHGGCRDRTADRIAEVLGCSREGLMI